MIDASAYTPDQSMLQRLAAELKRPAFHGFLGPIAEGVDADGTVSVRLPYKPEFSGSDSVQFYHGGIIASLIDLSAYAVVAIHTGRPAPTIDLRIDYLRPALPPSLIAQAAILKLGKSTARVDVRILSDDLRLVAVGRGTFSTLDQSRAG